MAIPIHERGFSLFPLFPRRTRKITEFRKTPGHVAVAASTFHLLNFIREIRPAPAPGRAKNVARLLLDQGSLHCELFK